MAKPNEKSANVESRDVRKTLRVMLTDSEKLKYGEEMGRETQRHVDARERKKAIVAEATEVVERHRTNVERIGSILANGYEYRDVECEVQIDRDNGRTKVVRWDTGEVIEDRPINAEERQFPLPL